MRRSVTIVVAAMAMMLSGALASTAQADSTRTEHCVTPNHIDINATLGISAAIVAPFCPTIKAGDWWVRAQFWTENQSWEYVPDGFVPVGATPLEDFVAKFVAIRYVVDQGTKHEFTVEFATGPSLWTHEHLVFPNTDVASAMTLGAVRPLRVGTHTVTSFWIFSAPHCDGFSPVFEESCVPAGAYDAGTDSFDVVAK